jgi:hypothetical protein
MITVRLFEQTSHRRAVELQEFFHEPGADLALILQQQIVLRSAAACAQRHPALCEFFRSHVLSPLPWP